MLASRLSVQYVTKPIDGKKPLPKSPSVPTRFLRLKLVQQLSRLKDIAVSLATIDLLTCSGL
jgi:hypothetical protein